MMFGQKLDIQGTSKGSDQAARMRRLVCAFGGRTYHIVGKSHVAAQLFWA